MLCTQPLLIHADGTGSCSVPGCLDQDTLTEAVRRHRHVVNCRAVLGTRCTLCHRDAHAPTTGPVHTGPVHTGPGHTGPGHTGPAGTGPAGTDTRGDVVMCPGVVVAHADLSLECSAPGCGPDLSRGAWLARHADVQSCADLDVACSLCSLPADAADQLD